MHEQTSADQRLAMLDELLAAAEEGTLDRVPADWINKENLTEICNPGPVNPGGSDEFVWETVIGKAAEHRHLDQIPGELLRVVIDHVVDAHGTTVLHLAAQSGSLRQVPESALNFENLFQRLDSVGWTAALLAAKKGFFNHIPARLQTNEHLAAADHKGWTLFHTAADRGFLDNIPKRFLTAKNLSLRTFDGTTPLHLAARSGQLATIPVRAFTNRNLTIRNSAGDTPLHEAAKRGGFGYIPDSNLCIDTVLQVDAKGNTPLHLLWQQEVPFCVNRGLYTPEVLAWRNHEGMTIIDYARGRGELEGIPIECRKACDAYIAKMGLDEMYDAEDFIDYMAERHGPPDPKPEQDFNFEF